MKTTMLTIAAVTLMATLSLATYAQPEPPKPGAVKPMLRPGRDPRPGREMLSQVSAFNGQVGNWVNNDDFVYDAFYLQTGSEKLLVKFPAQMGNQLKSLAKTGSTITVNGVADITPSGEKTIGMVSITANGQTIYDTPRAAPPTPNTEEFVNGTSKINALQKTQDGDINGFILDNKTILRVPPHVAMQLAQTAIAGANVSYTGAKKIPASGEVSAGNYTIVHCQTITLNDTQYLTR